MAKNKVGLFCFDGPLYRDSNGNYCSTTLTDEMFARFYGIVEKLYVVVRVFETDKTCQELNMKALHTDNMKIIGVDNLVSPKGLILSKPVFEKRIRKYLEKVDLVFARMPSIISDSVCKECISLNKPYLVEVGGCSWDSYWNHSLSGKIVAPLVFYWQKKYVKKAQFATYVTKEFLQKRYPNSNMHTNCSNVYLNTVDDDVLEARLSKIENMNFYEPVFGQVVASVDVKYKGEQYFIRAMSELKKMGIRARYEIVGPGMGDYIREQAKKYGVEKQIALLGAKKKEEVFEWLQGIDVYVQPSKQEGLPRSVIEAMSVGCPAIGSNIAGIPELLEDSCLFNPDKTIQIVKAVRNLLVPDNLKSQAIKNFKNAKEYNIEDIEKRRQKIFKEYLMFVVRE